MDVSSSSTPPALPEQRGLLVLMRRHPLFCYFLIAYALSWLGWLPLVLSQNGLGLLPFHLPLAAILGGGLGPIGSGFLMTAITSGKAGVRQLLHRFLLWRVGVQWYLLAILAIPALMFLGVLLAVPGALMDFHFSLLFSTLLLYAGLFILQMFISPLAEEPGWRGFALPRLQKCYGPLKGTLILGLLWACWHFPLFLIPGYNGVGTGFFGISIPFAEFMVSIIAGAMIITWAFNHTRGSLLIAMMIHSAIDSFPLSLLFPHMNIGEHIDVVAMVSFSIPALVLLVVTRGKLGYQFYRASREENSVEGIKG
jgi:membrane protease YdiL (CAAX protease family)